MEALCQTFELWNNWGESEEPFWATGNTYRLCGNESSKHQHSRGFWFVTRTLWRRWVWPGRQGYARWWKSYGAQEDHLRRRFSKSWCQLNCEKNIFMGGTKEVLFQLVVVKVKVKSLSRVRLFATLWTVAHQAPPSIGFSRQEYRSGVPFPSPGYLPDPGIEPRSPASQADTLTSEPLKNITWEIILNSMGKLKCLKSWQTEAVAKRESLLS